MENDPCVLFSEHHRKLLKRIEELGRQVDEDVLYGPELLACLYEQLLPHAQAEAATLYKRAATLPEGAALVQALLHEHETIRQQIQEVQEFFATRRDAALRNTIAALLVLLRTHFNTEEDPLLPKLRHYLTPQELSALFEEAHRLEEAAKPADLGRFLHADHHRVDRVLGEFSLLKQIVLQRVRTAFIHSKHGLLRHLAWEEDILLPLLEGKTRPHEANLIADILQEHTQIRTALERIERSLQNGELSALDTAERELGDLLTRHSQKEEQTLYPLLNRSLSAQEREALLARLA